MEKITNKMALTYVVTHCDNLPVEISGKLYAMIDALDRKASAPKKETPVQVLNKSLMEVIANFLKANAEVGYTCSEILRNVPELETYSVNKVSALVKKLVDNGVVTRTEVKRTAYFQYVTE